MIRLLVVGVIAMGLHAGVGSAAYHIAKTFEHPLTLRTRLLDKQLMREIRERIAQIEKKDDVNYIEIALEELDDHIAEMPEPPGGESTPLFMHDASWLPPPPADDLLAVALQDAPEPSGEEPEEIEPPPAPKAVAVLTGNDAKAAEIRSQLAQLDVAMVGALGKGGTASEGVLGSSDVPSGMLDEASRVTMGTTTSRDPGGAGGPGSGLRGLSGLGSTSVAIADRGRAATAPRGSVRVRPLATAGVANAASVLARMRGRFRACYRAALEADPAAGGTLRFHFDVDEAGNVRLPEEAKLPPLERCIRGVLASGGFSPPDSGERATLGVELTFESSR